MGFLSGFVGGMAGAYNDDRDAEKLDARKRAMAEYENELRAKSQATAEALREKFEQAKAQAKRTQDMTDAKTVQGASDDKRVERAQGLINADTGIQHTLEEVKKIIADPDWVNNYGARRDTADGKPTEWTEGGLINQTVKVTPSTDRTRAQELNDKADAAMGIGRMDMEKGFRDQGQLERQYQRQEDQDASTNKRLDNQDSYNTKHLDETIRHNKALEKAALARTGAEKLSPAAKVQLDIASTGLASAQKEESLAAKLLAEASKSMDAAVIESAKQEYATAKKGVTLAMAHYTQVGKAHLGDEWKDIVAPAPEKTTPAPPPEGARVANPAGEFGTVKNGKFVPDNANKPSANKDAGKPAAVGSSSESKADPLAGKSYQERAELAVQRSNLISTDPQLQSIKSEEAKLRRAGKGVEANGKLDEYNRMKQQKYGR